MDDEVKPVRVNSDGKFFDRLVPALISAALAVMGMAVVFWSDSRASDRETALILARFDKEISELKRSAEIDRQRTSELQADVKVLLAIMQRIERAVDPRNLPQR